MPSEQASVMKAATKMRAGLPQNVSLDLAQQAIKEVDGALGPPGTANPYNVPLAAEILRTYALVFDKPQNELQELADVLSEARTALTVG
jgi:hypothetical protein